MNRINQLFQEKKSEILSVYFCAGHPNSDGTLATIQAVENAGIDMIEIGIPFSDPLADGVVIQQAASESLRGGMTLKKLFSDLKDVRKAVKIPLIFMGYLNPILQFGYENFFAKCAEIGIDGVIIPDLPFEDFLTKIKPISNKFNIKVIMLITPQTDDERIRLIDEYTDGFIYMVSSAATTGAQNAFDADKQAYFQRIAAMNLRNPRMIGFGISNRQTLNAAFENASGAIIGSRFVSLLSEFKEPEIAVEKLLETL